MKKIADFDKESFKKQVATNIKKLYRKTLEEASPQEIYQAVSYACKDDIIDRWIATHKVYREKNVKKVYYLSMEFLMGRALGNNLLNLGYYSEVKEALEEMGLDINFIEDQERDPALGNGGLGRLAACFLDSLSTLGYPAYGCGIRYRYGMFKQAIVDGYQLEEPDDWLRNGFPFEVKRAEYAVLAKSLSWHRWRSIKTHLDLWRFLRHPPQHRYGCHSVCHCIAIRIDHLASD